MKSFIHTAVRTRVFKAVEWTIDTFSSIPLNTNIASTPFKILLGSDQEFHANCYLTIKREAASTTTWIVIQDHDILFLSEPATGGTKSKAIMSIKFNLCSSCYENEYDKPIVFNQIGKIVNKLPVPLQKTLYWSPISYNTEQYNRIVMTVSVEVEEILHQNTRIIDSNEVETKSEVSATEMPQLSADLEALYLSQEHADVKLRVGSTCIPAHRSILAARLKTFAALLKDGSNDIDIRDMTEDVLRELLLYLYTGRVKKFELAVQLVKVARVNDLAHLEDLCKAHLKKNMTVDNCLEVLALAHDCKIEDLKTTALRFFGDKVEEVQKHVSWCGFIADYPVLIAELFEIVAKPK